MTQRIKIRGNPWHAVHAQTHGPQGVQLICTVHCLTTDGRYFKKPMIDLYEPRKWCEKVGRHGSIDPQHWQFAGRDETPAGHSFRDLADHAELDAAGY